MLEKKCPTAEQLRDYLLGNLEEEQIDEVTNHVDDCPPCEDTVIKLEQESDTVISRLRARVKSAHVSDDKYQKALAFVKNVGWEQSQASRFNSDRESTPPIENLREYELLEKLGQGGMGTVYKARHTKLDKVVAIKVLPADRMKDETAVARFEREMRAVGKLDHPNIVRAMDAGEVDGTHFLVMEHVKGHDLAQIVRQHGPLPIADACEMIRQAAVGLDEADEHGMVHRDIKPSNLMLAEQRRDPPIVKVLDMGLALLSETHSTEATELTSTGQLMGTLDYMAPEQGGDSHEVDIRADIYALGATLYKLLTGQSIYYGPKYRTPVSKMMALANEPAPPIEDRRSEVSAELAAVVHQMLEKNPAKRIASPADVIAALAPFCEGADLNLYTSTNVVAMADDASSFQDTDSRQASASEVSTTPSISKSDAASKPQLAVLAVPPASRSRLFLIASGLGALVLFAAVTLYIQFGKGTLKVVIHDPSIEVTVKDGEVVISGVDKEGETRLIPGEYQLRIVHGDIEFLTDKFKLKRDETTVVEVSLVGDTISALQDALPLALLDSSGSPGVAAEAIVQAGKAATRWQPGSPLDVLPGLIPRPAKFAGIKRWQIETTLPRGDARSTSFSPDGTLLACGMRTGHVRIYDAKTLELVDLVVGHERSVLSMAWSPDGNWLASSSGHTVRVLNTKDASTTLIPLGPGARSISWAPDSTRFAVAVRDAVEVWTVDGKRSQRFVNGLEQGYSQVAWSRDGQWIASHFGNNQIRLWKTDEPEFDLTWPTDGGPTHSISWSPDSRRFATGGGKSSSIQIWKTDGSLDKEVDTSYSSVHSLDWNPLGNKLVASGTGIIVFDLDDESRDIVSKQGSNIYDVCWHPDGQRFVSVDELRSINIWHENGTLLVSKKGPDAAHSPDVKWSHDGEFVARVGYMEVLIWNVHGVSQAAIKAHGPIAWRPGTQEIVVQSANGKTMQLYDPRGKFLSTAMPLAERIYSITWSPDGNRLASGIWFVRDQKLGEIWEFGGKRIATLTGMKGIESGNPYETIISWSPDGSTLVTRAIYDVMRFWNPDGTPGAVIDLMHGNEVAWNPASDRLAIYNSPTMIVDLEGVQQSKSFGSHGNDSSAAWSPSGKRLVSGGYEGTVRFWSEDGSPQAVLSGHDSAVVGVDWCSTSSLVASTSFDMTVIVWDVETSEPVWIGVELGAGNFATFSAAGQLIDGDLDVVEEYFVYLIENEDGKRELLKPSEFHQRINQPFVSVPTAANIRNRVDVDRVQDSPNVAEDE